jgi:hypothetical protein
MLLSKGGTTLSYSKYSHLKIVSVISLSLLVSGCNMFTPLKKPEIGPAGTPVEAKPNPPLMQRFESPPGGLYDLEATAGVIFQGINKKDWLQTERGFSTLQTLWPQVKNLTGDKQGIKDADEAFTKLETDIIKRNSTDSYESLIKFMASISDVGKSYKLSPLSDIVVIGNTIRNVSFYVQDKAWDKAKAKVKELEGAWGQAKPSMEKVGILGEITKTHSAVKQLKDAVEAENKGAAEEQITNINESMGTIREYYHGK